MECCPPVELKDGIAEKRPSRLIDRRHGRLTSDEMRVQVPPPKELPSPGVPASDSSSLGLPHVQPDKFGRRDEELEEVKGFMELGFWFPEDELSPRVLSLLPGLKRFGCQQHNTVPADPIELPSPNGKSMDLMKKRLRMWARSVASTVKC